MKHDELRSIAHNAAASLASGISFLIAHYELDIFADAAQSPAGDLTVDFLRGMVLPQPARGNLPRAVAEFPSVLPAFCKKHGVNVSAFREMQARYWMTPLARRFNVMIIDQRGRRSETDYEGYFGKRVRALDSEGRARPVPVRSLQLRC